MQKKLTQELLEARAAAALTLDESFPLRKIISSAVPGGRKVWGGPRYGESLLECGHTVGTTAVDRAKKKKRCLYCASNIGPQTKS